MIHADRLAEAEKHLARTDAPMREMIRRYGPCTIGRKRRDPFAVLASSIISQQLSTKAAETIQDRVLAALGAGKRLAPRHFESASVAQLRACGLSNAKSSWLLSLAAAVRSGDLDLKHFHKLDDAAALEKLDELPGIGIWTAEMMLIFAFNRLDIYSMGDAGLRRAVNQIYNKGRKLNDAKTLKLTRAWSPYRSVASWYLWRTVDDTDAWA